ncbi:AraC family transcriptional regulator [Hydrocarboniclastica marina]|uniref:AraC family transcriptional regulator n=1 Tax=Hydrocarboniclastica marina TaxID=2259620 RepID=A0A4P7XIA6_9ALTE|nr:AraC family transcriptional regulator [Hydrocarboniclastica marina]MAL98648.1 AraC family transcriptional regulator [Alteromonadaceae bacterium]QCF25607.1 AraC family transcriptional regulator [Hydrocarboniclastica marina]|tara:strand:- start:7529 stop:8395 length:867 start_codon:yes stop_codon:yes gene_type:complete
MVEAQLMHLPDSGAHPRHQHNHYQVVVGLTGEADIDVEGQHAHLDGAHACVLPANIAHNYGGNTRNNVLVINLDHQMAAFQQPAHPQYEFLNRFFDHPRQVSLDESLQSLTQACSMQLQRLGHDPVIQHHLATALLQCMGSRLADVGEACDRSADMPKSKDLERIDRYIDANLHRRISVEDLAASVCLSRSHFHELFRQQLGQTPHQYLIRARLERAQILIEETGLPLWDISQRTGFSSQSALTNAMRKHMGVIPSSFDRPSLQRHFRRRACSPPWFDPESPPASESV